LRTAQHIEGIQIAWETPSAMMESLKAFAKSRQTALRPNPAKDMAIGSGARLFELHDGALVLCFSPDTWKTGDTVRISIPYIIVHGKRIDVPQDLWAAEDDGTGEDALAEFVEKHWTAEPERPKRKRKVKCLNGAFPPLLIDVVCTLEELYALGLTAGGVAEDAADYEIAVWLRKLAGDTLKSAEKYYAFLDKVRKRTAESELNGQDYDTAVNGLELNHNKAYNFLQSRNLLLAPKEEP
jgi:hypothetical protein